MPALPLPLDGWHRAQGARMVEFAGHVMPIQYQGIIAEHLWTRTHAALFDVSHMGQLLLHGPDLDAALEALVPADLRALAVGRLRYSLLLDASGGILDDLILTRRADSIYMVVNGATKADDIAHLRSRLPSRVAIDVLGNRALLALQGPAAAAVLERHAPGIARLRFLEGGDFVVAGIPAWISRSGYTGEDGFEISITEDRAEALAALLVAEPEVLPAGLGARDSLRLEAGLPLYGHDLDRDTTPIAADLTFALSRRRRDAGGYLGADAIANELAHGAASRRVGLLVEGRQPVREGATVIAADGQDIGRVTSGGFSPSLEAPIAMAYVPVALAAPGTELVLAQRGRTHRATVTPLPFVPHRYARSHDALLHAGT